MKRERTAFTCEYFPICQTHSGNEHERTAKDLLKMASSQWITPSFK